MNYEGSFRDPWHIDAIKITPTTTWWKEYRGEMLELQYIVTCVLSIIASSGACEHN